MANFRSAFSRVRWRVRLTLWLASALAGLTVVAFAKLSDLALGAFHSLFALGAWVPFVLTPAVGMLAVWLTGRFFKGAQGSGIPQVIAAARMVQRGQDVSHLVSLRIAAGKVLVGAFALLGGFSVGREGPSVQVAASVLHGVRRLLPRSRVIQPSELILAGGAAGVAAAFNTPLAGIVFAIEELARRMEIKTSGVLISTIILAGLVSIAVSGNYNYFGSIRIVATDLSIAIPVLVAGLACGLAGGGFSRLLLWPQTHARHAIWDFRKRHPVWFAGVCGLLVAAVGWLAGGYSFGSGYTATAKLIAGELELPWYASVTRLCSTLLSYHSGIPGGIFAPSLAIGAALGSVLGQLHVELGGQLPLIALCMAGFLAAVTQSPVTSAIIVMEMIDSHEMVISLMAVALIAKAVSSRLSPELYQFLAQGWLQDAAAVSRDAEAKPGQ